MRTPVAAPAVVPSAVPAPVEAAPRETPPALVTFVADVENLPLFSGAAMQLMQSVGREDVSTDELARLISADAGLTASLLRIVNSSFYALPKKISTVSEAIAVLGMNHVRRTVSASVSQRPVAEYLRDSKVVRAFWRHLLLTAAMSRHIALQRGLDAEVAHMAGLMHKVGRLVLLIRNPHLDNLLLDVDGSQGDGLGPERERKHFGFDHAQVGGALLERWGLPTPIVRATFDHLDATQPADPMSAVVWRANLLAQDMIHEPDELEAPLPWMTAVNLTLDDRRKIFDEIAALESGAG